MERCLILEEELSKARMELSRAVTAGETVNTELNTLRAYVSHDSFDKNSFDLLTQEVRLLPIFESALACIPFILLAL